ncbi:MAG: hypothetical protein HKN18_17220 [Silicimonas sp.]|nr:hypothetical protein [Silicimonas sp.]
MTPTITASYAALLTLFLIAMSFYVIITRAKTDTLLGHGESIPMLVAMRRHGNLIEYMPFAILIMALAELLGLGSTWLHVSGIALVAGRLIHPFGVAENSPLVPRVIGVLLTFAAMVIPAIAILFTTLA